KYYDSSVSEYRVSREVTECTPAFQVAWDDISGTAVGYPWIGLGLGNYKEAVTDSILSTLTLSDTYPCTLFVRVGREGKSVHKEYLVSIDTRLNDDVNWFINLPAEVGVSEKVQAKLPKKYFLDQNYPNPFNASTMIKYGLPEPADVKIEITNVLGQTVRTLVNEHQAAGTKQVIWDGRDENGKEVPSGVYFYSLKTEKFKEKKRMILVK
ncbi:MAG: FlgD immunoglobulin-like domain containing protein, partial [bacterium]